MKYYINNENCCRGQLLWKALSELSEIFHTIVGGMDFEQEQYCGIFAETSNLINSIT